MFPNVSWWELVITEGLITNSPTPTVYCRTLCFDHATKGEILPKPTEIHLSWFHTNGTVEQSCLSLLFSQNSFSPKSDTIKSAPVIGAVVSAKLGSCSQHGPGSCAVWADISCLLGGRAELSGWQRLSEPGASCQHLARSSWTQKEMTALCCINVARLLTIDTSTTNTLSSATESSVETRDSVGLCEVSLSVSLHLSHDFPDLASPGVCHLGHQLHSQVNYSSKWSAKQCRKKTPL